MARTPIPIVLTDLDVEKFAMLVGINYDDPDDCWPWTGRIGDAGYGAFRVPGMQRSVFAHRVAALLAYGPHTAAKPYVLHSCDYRPCCNFQHLRYGTDADNGRDRALRGRAAYGARQGLTHLTDDDVRAMRIVYARGVPTPELGRIFDISTSTAWRIIKEITWKHLS